MFAENLWRRNTSSRFSSERHLFAGTPAAQHTPTGQRPRATDLAVCERPVGEAQIDCRTDTRSARTTLYPYAQIGYFHKRPPEKRRSQVASEGSG